MPIMSNARKRSRGNVGQVRTLVVLSRHGLDEHSRQGPSGSALTGWDFIQEKILSHDEDMIADFADDIDTLLVFVSAKFLSLLPISYDSPCRLASSRRYSRLS